LSTSAKYSSADVEETLHDGDVNCIAVVARRTGKIIKNGLKTVLHFVFR